MARKQRSWEPGAIHHVDVRAHDGAPILRLDDDRAFVVDRAARVFREEGAICLAWAVLVNHFHLLVRFDGPPGKAMQRLNTAVAMRIRRRHGGAGAVFQGVYWSAVCTDEAATLTRLAYVTANPLHHHVVGSLSELERWPWSSLGEVTGRRVSKLADPRATLLLIDDDPARALDGLTELLEIRARIWRERDETTTRNPDVDDPPEVSIPLRRSLGDTVGAPQSLRAVHGAVTAPSLDWESVAARRALLRADGWRPADLVAPACEATGADASAVRVGDRRRTSSLARALVAHVAVDHVNWPTNEVARALGVTGPAILAARRKGAAAIQAAGIDADELLRRSGAQGDSSVPHCGSEEVSCHPESGGALKSL